MTQDEMKTLRVREPVLWLDKHRDVPIAGHVTRVCREGVEIDWEDGLKNVFPWKESEFIRRFAL